MLVYIMSIHPVEPIVASYTYSEFDDLEGGGSSKESTARTPRAGLPVHRILQKPSPSRFENHVVPAGLVYLPDFVPTKDMIERERSPNLVYDMIDDNLFNRLMDMVSVNISGKRAFAKINKSLKQRPSKKRITIRK